MAKKLISSADLTALIAEELSEPEWRHRRALFAVVSDERNGWRVIVANRTRRSLNAVDEQRLADIQRRLRGIYALR